MGAEKTNSPPAAAGRKKNKSAQEPVLISLPALRPARMDDGVGIDVSNDLIMKEDSGYTSPLVVESYKLVLFNIPKNNFSIILRLALRMMGREDWKTIKDPKAAVKYLSHCSPAEAMRIMEDQTWTRAIFLNEPKQRLLSTYLDLVVGSDYVSKKFNVQPSSFAAFVVDSQTHKDPHWASQTDHLGDKWWPSINFVGTIANAERDIQRLLERVGAWEKFGACGWGEDGKQRIFADSKVQPNGDHYTPELEEMVQTLYASDYARFDFLGDPAHPAHNSKALQ